MRGRNYKGNVFVGNLPHDLADERLAEAFDSFGMVLSAAVARDPVTGARLRYGFVDIATEKAAKAAVAGLNGTQLEGSKLSVQLSEKPVKKPGAGPLRRPRPSSTAPLMPRRESSVDGAGEPAFPAMPRPRPTFQVERRPLRPLARRLTPQ